MGDRARVGVLPTRRHRGWLVENGQCTARGGSTRRRARSTRADRAHRHPQAAARRARLRRCRHRNLRPEVHLRAVRGTSSRRPGRRVRARAKRSGDPATPSVRSNKAAYETEADCMRMLADLAGFLHGRGYSCPRSHDTRGADHPVRRRSGARTARPERAAPDPGGGIALPARDDHDGRSPLPRRRPSITGFTASATAAELASSGVPWEQSRRVATCTAASGRRRSTTPAAFPPWHRRTVAGSA